MNTLAKELNDQLQGTIIYDLLSDLGKRMYFPKGIVAQSSEAKQHASRYNATIGMAVSQGKAMILPAIAEQFSELSSTEAVAYAPTGGIAELRSLWKKEIGRKNPTADCTKISEPVVVSGLTNGIAQVADLFVDRGDVVVVPDMFWGNYRLIIEEKREASLAEFPFFEAGGLHIAGFRQAMIDNAVNGKIVTILNFPNNPTGYSPTVEEAHAVAKMLQGLAEEGYKILAIMDDAYFGLFYEKDTYRESVFSLLHNLHENILAVKIDGPTKEHFVWGFRLGFVTFGSKSLTTQQYEALNKKLTGAIRSSISSSSQPAQSLLLHALKRSDFEAEKARLDDSLEKRYFTLKKIVEANANSSVLKALPFNSGYFMSFEMISGSAEALRKELLMKEGIGVISIKDRYIRVAYSSVDEKDLNDMLSVLFKTAEKMR
ncbi:MAG: aminotransferase class I/II-fold pyridoxal phosphate-dependent enzyme [Spirochaetales bacterium]|nr:aminotransferase class I/II-fold pyridoxal phosphate-dependent enzyme [Spirochaetales bacterium]